MEKPKPSRHRSFMCEKCGEEFSSLDEYKQHKVEHNLGARKPQEVAQEVVIEEKKVEVKEVKKNDKFILKYVWEGSCPDCGSQVDTIDLDSIGKGKEYIVIAYCNHCKKKLRERPVKKL